MRVSYSFAAFPRYSRVLSSGVRRCLDATATCVFEMVHSSQGPGIPFALGNASVSKILAPCRQIALDLFVSVKPLAWPAIQGIIAHIVAAAAPPRGSWVGPAREPGAEPPRNGVRLLACKDLVYASAVHRFSRVSRL